MEEEPNLGAANKKKREVDYQEDEMMRILENKYK
jgi:hypothetical protein